ncbi:MAG TPA: hypothetical protein VMB21_09140 [Candidatus Limnocylindria bacterium]|nr:hypothetical protein [Candidatus Limnocylindria bacterium]
MRTRQQLADNWIVRRFSPSSRKGRLPLDDHGMECLAWSLLGPLAEAFGGGEAGRPAAAFVLDLRHDLELGTLTRKPEPGPAESNPVKPSQT